MPHFHAAAVADRLLRRLASDARRLELPPHIDDDLVHVGRTLSRLQDVLVSLEARSEAQEWMGNIKQVAYDLEDLLDEFGDHSSIKSQTSSCIAEAAPLCCACPFLQHTSSANRMKAIRRRLDCSAKDSVILTLMQYSCPDVEKFDNGVFDSAAIIGRDADKAKIKDMLLQSNEEKLSVIPIVGLVGLGKTTLARLIFLDQEEGWNFDCRVWICLNRKLDLKMVASDIISQCNHTEESLLDFQTDIEIQGNLQLLKNSLQEALCEKRCLIVLDDLSSTDKSQLDELKEMLKGTNECVKVLVTTSSEITAELVHTIPPYKLCALSEDDSWTIFSHKAVGNWDGNNAHLMEVGKEIMKRCEGIPLLTHSLGSAVQNQDTNVWLAARDEEIWKLQRRLATEGSAIDKEKLIRQWIALEIIGSKHDSFPPYVHGEMCIQDLLSTCFLQVQNMHSIYGMVNGIVPGSLYIHNFVHEFARHVACDDIIVLDGSEMQKGSGKWQTFQYALLTCYRGQSTLSHSLLTRAKALHLRNSEAIMIHSEAFELLKHLRVLNLSGCCIGELPASVGYLKHLKYLDVSGIQIQTLPSSLSRLTNLEWFKSTQTLEEVVIDGETLTSFELLEIQGTQEPSGSTIPTESDGAHKDIVIDSSTIVMKPSPRFSTTSEHSADPISSSQLSMASREIPSTLHRLDKSEMSAQTRRDGSLNLSLKQVRKATQNFSPLLKLGEGGIWEVYRAALFSDNHIVTIRRAKKGHAQEAKHLMKVQLLKEINHWSVVRFLGFIDKGNECIRITEYVPNGTLRQHLHDQHKRILDFNQRIVIALDVAIALTYLHLASGQAVICYNLKTSNILLTESYRAKVCCSELSGSGHVVALRGTAGYIDPEYFQTSELTAKSDVYSFGIILLEILSSHGPQDWKLLMNHQQSSVVQWALEKFYDDLMNEILDYRMEDRVAGEVLRDWLSLALSCVASCGNDRPSIEVAGERLWKIWKDHRRNIGEQHEYEGSWEEFVEQEGILRHQKSVLKRNWAPSATEEEWSGYIKQIELVQEGYSVMEEREHISRSRSASFGDITVSPR
ncbi:unnamed protein product [Urochloa humidicola]